MSIQEALEKKGCQNSVPEMLRALSGENIVGVVDDDRGSWWLITGSGHALVLSAGIVLSTDPGGNSFHVSLQHPGSVQGMIAQRRRDLRAIEALDHSSLHLLFSRFSPSSDQLGSLGVILTGQQQMLMGQAMSISGKILTETETIDPVASSRRTRLSLLLSTLGKSLEARHREQLSILLPPDQYDILNEAIRLASQIEEA